MKFCNHNPSKIWRKGNKSIPFKQFIEMYNAEYANLVGDRNYADQFFGKIGVSFNEDFTDGNGYTIVDADSALVNQNNTNTISNNFFQNTQSAPNKNDVQVGLPAFDEKPVQLKPTTEIPNFNSEQINISNPSNGSSNTLPKENPQNATPDIIVENNKILGGDNKDVADVTTTSQPNTVINNGMQTLVKNAKTNNSKKILLGVGILLIVSSIYLITKNKNQ